MPKSRRFWSASGPFPAGGIDWPYQTNQFTVVNACRNGARLRMRMTKWAL
jgi:hypothetical protein